MTLTEAREAAIAATAEATRAFASNEAKGFPTPFVCRMLKEEALAALATYGAEIVAARMEAAS